MVEGDKHINGQGNTGEGSPPPNKGGGGARNTAPGSYNSRNPIRGLFSLCHVKVINPPPCKVDEIEH